LNAFQCLFGLFKIKALFGSVKRAQVQGGQECEDD
jgi:hypothetical protein